MGSQEMALHYRLSYRHCHGRPMTVHCTALPDAAGRVGNPDSDRKPGRGGASVAPVAQRSVRPGQAAMRNHRAATAKSRSSPSAERVWGFRQHRLLHYQIRLRDDWRSGRGPAPPGGSGAPLTQQCPGRGHGGAEDAVHPSESTRGRTPGPADSAAWRRCAGSGNLLRARPT